MKFTQENFNTLEEKNLVLEAELKSKIEFSQGERLNESEIISQTGSWNWDVKSGKVEWSDMMYRLLGLEPKDEIPSYQLALDHVHDDDKVAYEKSLTKAMNNREEYYLENRVVKKDKTIINVISRGICIFNEENELIRMVGTVQDISLLKQLLRTNRKLEQFADVIAHDFKEPIAVIVSCTQLIKIKFLKDLTERGQELFSFIESSAKDLSALVDDTLEYSKLSSPQIKYTAINTKEYIEEIISNLSILIAEKEGDVSLGWLPESIYADRVKLKQVFQNLILNALKYTEIDRKPKIEIFCEEKPDQFIFYLKDSGIGMDNQFTDEIFAPYVRAEARESFSGTGIGLSICKRIIQMHSGDIEYYSNKDVGTCFYFSLPKQISGPK